MANIFDYLDWRADVPFSADPFNEVDNLVLAQLAYTDFGGIVSEDGAGIPLRDASKAFFEEHSREEILADTWLTAKAPLLMEKMVEGARFRDTMLSRYVNETDPEQGIQLSAVTFTFPDGSAYIAFRGTDATLVGWKEDFHFAFLSETEGQGRAVSYLEDAAKGVRGPLYVGGHSKGGNLAVYAASFCEREVQNRIVTVYSNDGPGFREEILERPGYLYILPKVVSIIPEMSVIGLLLSTKSEHRVIKSSAFGILQHDALTWSVHRNRFVEAPLKVVSKLIDKSLSDWLKQMDGEARKFFTETIFSLFESTGAENFIEIAQQKWKSTEAIFTAIREMSKETRQEMLSQLQQLGQSSSQTAAEYLLSLLNKKK
ncbi:MAG: Mbeg1-like protein [Christensenellales bacterium]|jgi:hypothetical protein